MEVSQSKRTLIFLLTSSKIFVIRDLPSVLINYHTVSDKENEFPLI